MMAAQRSFPFDMHKRSTIRFGLVLALSMVCNIVLLLRRTPVEKPLKSAAGSPSKSVAILSAAPEPAALNERDITQLIDEMRSAGATDETLRAVVTGMLWRRYRGQLSEEAAKRYARGWWRDEERLAYTNGIGLSADPRLLFRTVTEPLFKLLAMDPVFAAEADAHYSFLSSRELRQALERIEVELPRGWAPTGDAEEDAKLRAEYYAKRLAGEQKRLELLARLPPEQRNEFEVRFGTITPALARQMESLSLSEGEFRAIQPIASAYAEAIRSQSVAGTGTTTELQQRFGEEIINKLGYERALDLIWSGSSEYPPYARASRENNLPSSAAGAAVQVAAETAGLASKVYNDPALTIEEKRVELSQLQIIAQARFDAIIPPAVQASLPANSLSWLKQLSDGKYKIIETALPGTGPTLVFGHTVSIDTPAVPSSGTRQFVPSKPKS